MHVPKWIRAIAIPWRYAPITATFLSVAVLLLLAVNIYELSWPNQAHNALWHLGGVVQLKVTVEPTLGGPLDIWDAQLWRIPICAFHHANILHLLMNCSCIWFLGTVLERRIGWLAYSLFFLLAAVVPVLSELLFQNYGVGLSGVAFAIFGFLLPLRQFDARVKAAIPNSVVKWSFLWLLACVVVTYLGVIRIGNVAHFSGLGYGWLVGHVFCGRFRNSPIVKISFCSAHIFVVVAMYIVMHPFWVGSYHWYASMHVKEISKRVPHWERALACDPSLARVWSILSAYQLKNGDWQQAWSTILHGIELNRSDADCAQLARIIWSQRKTAEQRQEAKKILADVFGNETAAWQPRLCQEQPNATVIASDMDDTEQEVQYPPVILAPAVDGSEDIVTGTREPPHVNPDDPNSAAVDFMVTL